METVEKTQHINLKNIIFGGVTAFSLLLKLFYDWDKLIVFSPPVIGGLLLEIAPFAIIQIITFLTTQKDMMSILQKNKAKQKEFVPEVATILFQNIFLRFFLIVALAFILTLFYNPYPDFWTGWIISFFNTFFIWEGIHRFVQMLLKYYPNYAQTPKRLLIQFVSVVVYAFVVSLAVGSFSEIFLPPNSPKYSILIDFAIALAPTLFFTWLYETVFFFRSWKINAQKLEKIN